MAIRFEHRNGRQVAVHVPNTDAEADRSWAQLHRACDKLRAEREAGGADAPDRRLAEIEYKKFQDLQARQTAKMEHDKFLDLTSGKVRYKYVRPSGSRSMAAWALTGVMCGELGIPVPKNIEFFCEALSAETADFSTKGPLLGECLRSGEIGLLDAPFGEVIDTLAHEIKHWEQAQGPAWYASDREAPAVAYGALWAARLGLPVWADLDVGYSEPDAMKAGEFYLNLTDRALYRKAGWRWDYHGTIGEARLDYSPRCFVFHNPSRC